MDGSLEIVGTTITVSTADPPRAPALPDLRTSYATFERTCPRNGAGAELLAELDEIVDASNGLAALVGLDPVDVNR